MILVGHSPSRALDATLEALGSAVGDTGPESDELWMLGAPGAGDWSTIASWEGRVHALITPTGMYRDPLIERADDVFCFAADEPLLAGISPTASVAVPRSSTGGPPAPPALGTSLGDVWQRRLVGRRGLPETCGVAWIDGAGAGALADASAAWARGRAVIACGDAAARSLGRGAAIPARSALEVDEATSFLEECPPITRALAREGARQREQQPTPGQVARSLVDAARLGSPISSR